MTRTKKFFLVVLGHTLFDDMNSIGLNGDKNTTPNPMAKQLFAVIDHFKNPDPIGLPVPIPDPIESPEPVEQNINVGKLVMRDVKVYGISKFRIQNVTVEMDKKMEAGCGLVFDTLTMRGNYSLSSLFMKSNGMLISLSSNVLGVLVDVMLKKRL